MAVVKEKHRINGPLPNQTGEMAKPRAQMDCTANREVWIVARSAIQALTGQAKH